MNALKRYRVLMVDDEPNLQAGFRRFLCGEFEPEFATSGPEALDRLRKGEFQIVVTDMRMPGMSGIQLTQEARRVRQDVVFILLTGNADQQTAVSAINDGHIFRFLNKPCAQDNLLDALRAATRQYEVNMAERELLRGTLMGSVRLLSDVLETANPTLAKFQKSVRQTTRQLAMALGIDPTWQMDLAASLCLMGVSVLGLHREAGELSDADLEQCAQMGARLLGNIPRLEPVAAMVRRQREDGLLPSDDDFARPESREVIGARLIRFAVDFDRELAACPGLLAAIVKLKSRTGVYDPKLLAVAAKLEIASLHLPNRIEWVQQKQPTTALKSGMIVCDDVRSSDGVLLLSRGHDLSPAAIERLRILARRGLISDSIEVMTRATGPSSLAA